MQLGVSPGVGAEDVLAVAQHRALPAGEHSRQLGPPLLLSQFVRVLRLQGRSLISHSSSHAL